MKITIIYLETTTTTNVSEQVRHWRQRLSSGSFYQPNTKLDITGTTITGWSNCLMSSIFHHVGKTWWFKMSNISTRTLSHSSRRWLVKWRLIKYLERSPWEANGPLANQTILWHVMLNEVSLPNTQTQIQPAILYTYLILIFLLHYSVVNKHPNAIHKLYVCL